MQVVGASVCVLIALAIPVLNLFLKQLSQYFGRRFRIFWIIFNDAPSVNVGNVARTFRSQELEPADPLAESIRNPGCNGPFRLT